jgi:hypothetical protein
MSIMFVWMNRSIDQVYCFCEEQWSGQQKGGVGLQIYTTADECEEHFVVGCQSMQAGACAIKLLHVDGTGGAKTGRAGSLHAC